MEINESNVMYGSDRECDKQTDFPSKVSFTRCVYTCSLFKVCFVLLLNLFLFKRIEIHRLRARAFTNSKLIQLFCAKRFLHESCFTFAKLSIIVLSYNSFDAQQRHLNKNGQIF